jgi:hypothetical protein
LYSLFSYASKESSDELVKEWADQPKNAVRLLGSELNLESSLNYVSKICRYMMGTDARIIRTQQNNIWVVIRHNMGKNYSYFWNQMFLHFFALLQDYVDVMTEYDETTISIRLKAPIGYVNLRQSLFPLDFLSVLYSNNFVSRE